MEKFVGNLRMYFSGKGYFPIVLLWIIFVSLVSFHLYSDSIDYYGILFIFSSALFPIFAFSLAWGNISERGVIGFLFLILVLHASFIFTEPLGSDDYFRYLWDGKVQLNGYNPYEFSPNAEELKELHSELLPEKVTYPELRTIYFPVAEGVFSIAYLLTGENGIGLKIMLLLSEIMIFLSLLLILRRLEMPSKNVLIYATLPLILFQYFVDAHIDLFGAALMIGGIALYIYDRKLLGFLLLGLSISVKPVALLILPFLFQFEEEKKAKIGVLVIPPIVFLITCIPYFFTATPIDTLLNYSLHWTFNGMIFNIIELFSVENYSARVICGILYLILYIIIYLSRIGVIGKIYYSIFFLMLFTPIVQPWYLVWFALFLPIIRSISGIYYVSAISLTVLTVLEFHSGGVWKEYPMVLLLQYVPLLFLMIVEAWWWSDEKKSLQYLNRELKIR